MSYKLITGETRPDDANIAIVASRYNDAIVDRLLAAGAACLNENGIHDNAITVVRVPGAWELPITAQALAATGEFDAIIALGAVIRGDTPHFEYICTECARGLNDTALRYDLPVIFGVLTVDDYEQALLRSGEAESNKGTEAALTALECISVLRKIKHD